MREESGWALVDTVIATLRGWHGLVVLDNCEHVVGGCAALVGELQGSCPRVSVLATSREPLAIDGETTWEVPPLPVPDPQARSAEEVVAADALALFETRARQVRPDFAVTDDNAAAVAEICWRLRRFVQRGSNDDPRWNAHAIAALTAVGTATGVMPKG